jgi:plastocyanin
MAAFFPEARTRRLRLAAAALLCLLARPAGGSVEARQAPGGGTIAGRVSAPEDDFFESLRRGRKLLRYETHSMPSEPIQPYRLSEVAAVYVESAPAAGAVAPPAGKPSLNQFQMVFRPLVLPVTAGTTVDFPNNDNLYHNVFSYSQPGEFDLGRYPKGKKRSVRFDEPGIVNVYCDIHSYMFATIIVLDNPYFALPADDGSFAIAGVPEGTYDLTFWYGRKKVSTKRVSVQEGRTSSVNFP